MRIFCLTRSGFGVKLYIIMVIDKADALLNDAEINYLADLFLVHYGFDRSSLGYRYFRNAVILASHGVMSVAEAYPLLAACADTDVGTYVGVMSAAVAELPKPVASVFNAVFAPNDAPFERCEHIVMRERTDLGYIISFLGAAFMYLILSNYPKYEYVAVDGLD